MATRFRLNFEQIFGTSAQVLAGGTLTFCISGGAPDQLRAIYQDPALAVTKLNPVVLDSAGKHGDIWLDDPSLYRVILKDAAGIVLPGGDIDPIDGAVATIDDFPWIDVTWAAHGAVGDGVADDTAAIQSAVDAATAAGHKAVIVPAGIYRITNTITIHEGVPIIGVGGQGSDYTNGVVYMCEPAANNTIMFLWDGNGAFVGGTGGGLQNALIMKNNAATGCTAIKVIATDDNHRPGEMIFRNILSYGVGSFRFNEGFVVDGTAANTPGGKGVRSILAEKIRIASCDMNNIRLTQAVHFWSTYLEIDSGTAAAAKMLIDGDWDDIFLNGLELNGTLTINAVASPANDGNISATGRIAVLDCNAAHAQGAMAIQSTAITNASKKLKIVSNISDAVRADIITPSFNQLGDGTSIAPAPMVLTIGNINNNWDALNDLWVCKIAGKYAAHWSGSYTGMGAAHTRHDTIIVHDNGSGGILASLGNGPSNPFACAAVGGNAFGATADGLFECAEGERLYPRLNVSGGTKTVGLFGGPIGNGEAAFFSVVPVQG